MSALPSKTVHNERVKLRATALNSLAIASVAAGFITPLAALSFGLTSGSDRSLLVTAGAARAWFGIGVALHMAAIWVLGGMQE